MKYFKVNITETILRHIWVLADDLQDAVDIAEQSYSQEETLDVSFEVDPFRMARTPLKQEVFFMKKYKVTITETLQKEVEVEAPNCVEAERLVNKQWIDGNYILDADHFKDVDFKATLIQRERGYER